MRDAGLESVLRRDRTIVAASLGALTLVAWGYILWLQDPMSMDAGEMPGMAMDSAAFGGAMAGALHPWSGAEFVLAFVMWMVMMIGMMTPSVAPMVLLYARVGRQAAAQGQPIAASGWFAGGYLLAWALFSLAATAAQGGLERAALLTPAMAAASPVLGAAILIAAGLYQWSPLKNACLAQCQAPLTFIQRHGGFRRQARGALGLGLRHGAYCVGCCWSLMALLFVGGVMNVLWIAAITIFVLAEKIVPAGRLLSRAAGLGFIAAGVWMLT